MSVYIQGSPQGINMLINVSINTGFTTRNKTVRMVFSPFLTSKDHATNAALH